MYASNFILFIAIVALALTSILANASDPDPLQDFCVAVNDSKTAVFVNGRICKDPDTVTSNDFFYSGLNNPGNITNPVETRVTSVFINQLPGLNTLGVAMARIDFAPNGLNPPHEHPRASEIFFVAKGTLYVGFITSNPSDRNMRNKLYAKILRAGDVFVFPKGLIHFQLNLGNTSAYAFASFNSQNPGVVTIANVLFGSEPLIKPEVLAKAFELDEDVVEHLQSLPWTHNN